MADLVTQIKPLESDAPRKLGLALSGGGFRTALFHIGSLLRMAELGVLKHVQAISTVSAGRSWARCSISDCWTCSRSVVGRSGTTTS